MTAIFIPEKARTALDNLVMTIKYRLHICQHDGCWKRDAVPCFLPDYDEPEGDDGKPSYYYCFKHAPQEGFCYICRQFWAGIESFDFIHPGLCDNCNEQIEHDFDDGDDDDYDPLSDYYGDLP